MTFVDSSVWIAYFYKEDSQHAQAERVFRTLTRPLLLHEYVIGEVCTVLNQRVSKLQADAFIEYVMGNRDIRIIPSNAEFFLETLSFFRKQRRRSLSFIDVALLYLSKQSSVVTFDRTLARAFRQE